MTIELAEDRNSPSEMDIDPLTHPSYATRQLTGAELDAFCVSDPVIERKKADDTEGGTCD